MTSSTLSFSATIVSHNLKEEHVSTRTNSSSVVFFPSTIKCDFLPSRRRRFARNRTPSFREGVLGGYPYSKSGLATESENVQSPVSPTSVPVRVAHELLQAGHRYLDVRTPEEFAEGHVVGAVNVPFMLRLGPGMARNPNFVQELLSSFRKDREIIVGCQLGKRSLMAASELLSAGFTGITDMAGGYEAWVSNGLPTEK